MKVTKTMPDEPKSFHDVARAGSTDPQHTSRPTIVGRAELAHDPMMREEEKLPLANHSQTSLQPPTLTAENLQAEAMPASELDGPIEAIAKSKTEADVKDKQQLDQRVQQLINDKTYAVPVGHLQRKRKLRTVLLVLTVLLICAGVGVLIVTM